MVFYLYRNLSVLFFLALVSYGNVLANSPWVQSRGKFTTRFDLSYIPSYQELYSSESDPFPTERKISDATFQIFSDYGLYDGGSLGLLIPLKRVEAGNLIDATNTTPITSNGSLLSSGNISLIWKHALLEWDTRISGQIQLELPTGAYDASTGLRTGYDAMAIVPSISIGAGSEKYYYFLYASLGYRTNKYSEFFKNGVEGGYKIAGNFWLGAVLDLLHSFENGTRLVSEANYLTGLYVDNQEFLAWGIKFFGDINPSWGISGAFFGAFSGNFVPKAPLFNVGVYYFLK